MVAPRLLMGDYGVHNANIGVALRKKNKNEPMIVSLDFGACFERGLTATVAPFSIPKTRKFYKNHFLEYNDEIIKSKEMAWQFYKTGSIDINPVIKELEKRIDDVARVYSMKSLKKFAKRLGLNADKIKNLKKDALIQAMKDHVKNNMPARAASMRQEGIQLLIRCYFQEKKDKTTTSNTFISFLDSIDGYDGSICFDKSEPNKTLINNLKQEILKHYNEKNDHQFSMFKNSFEGTLIQELKTIECEGLNTSPDHP